MWKWGIRKTSHYLMNAEGSQEANTERRRIQDPWRLCWWNFRSQIRVQKTISKSLRCVLAQAVAVSLWKRCMQKLKQLHSLRAQLLCNSDFTEALMHPEASMPPSQPPVHGPINPLWQEHHTGTQRTHITDSAAATQISVLWDHWERRKERWLFSSSPALFPTFFFDFHEMARQSSGEPHFADQLTHHKDMVEIWDSEEQSNITSWTSERGRNVLTHDLVEFIPSYPGKGDSQVHVSSKVLFWMLVLSVWKSNPAFTLVSECYQSNFHTFLFKIIWCYPLPIARVSIGLSSTRTFLVYTFVRVINNSLFLSKVSWVKL